MSQAVVCYSRCGMNSVRRCCVVSSAPSWRSRLWRWGSVRCVGSGRIEPRKRRELTEDGMTLSEFVRKQQRQEAPLGEVETGVLPIMAANLMLEEEESVYRFHIKTYGCQMNVNDSDIVRAVLVSTRRFVECGEECDADVLLTNTCAIRENAELKVWNRLQQIHSLSRKQRRKVVVGVLGCMAERLKTDLFQKGTVDLVAGPDSYRELPRLLLSLLNEQQEHAMHVQLSLEETYADITPIRRHPSLSAFVTVMRGCNNMCSYCVVPFTRGRERSRDLPSIVDECRHLFQHERVKEIVLLGQNVNSYHDRTGTKQQQHEQHSGTTYQTSNEGFTNLYKLRGGEGFYFADLVEAVSDISPELRVRFTSPHPKDYPPELLSLMAERTNVCNQLHMPAQSGSTSVLQRMRRGYTREAYLQLIETVRHTLPDVALSSDFITGFCGETDEEHADTLSLLESVQFDQAFMFAYSIRERTHAHRTMMDDISSSIKSKRLTEIIDTFRTHVQIKNEATEVGKLRLVLVEGESKRSTKHDPTWGGRTDQNKRIIFPTTPTTDNDDTSDGPMCWREEDVASLPLVSSLLTNRTSDARKVLQTNMNIKPNVRVQVGDYAVVQVTEAKGHTLRGGPVLWRTTMKNFHELFPTLYN